MICVYISIFYVKKKWRKLLNEAILDLINNYNKNDIESKLLLRFCNNRGECIEISYYINESNIFLFQNIFVRNLEAYLTNNQYKSKVKFKPGTDYFLPFTPNQICFNLHNYPLNINTPVNNNYLYALSTTICNYFSKRNVTDSELSTFSIYLNLYLIIKIILKSRKIEPIAEEIKCKLATLLNDTNFKELNDLYTDNREFISNSINDLLNIKSSSKISWILPWAGAVESNYNIESWDYSYKEIASDEYILISDAISYHLNFNIYAQNMIRSLMYSFLNDSIEITNLKLKPEMNH